MKTSSGKAKGAMTAAETRALLLSACPELEEGDVKLKPSSVTGPDQPISKFYMIANQCIRDLYISYLYMILNSQPTRHSSVKKIGFVDTSRKDLKRLSKVLQQEIGFDLWLLQQGLGPRALKPMTSVGQGGCEIRVRYDSTHSAVNGWLGYPIMTNR